MTTSLLAALLLADDGAGTVQQVGEDPQSWIGPGLGGFLAIFFISLATILLIRSMTKHLRNVRYSTPPGEEGDAPEPAEHVVEAGEGPDVTSRG